MSWARGTGYLGRRIGYGYAAKCHLRGCGEKIDRGLSFWCGDVHFTGDGYGCGWFFCEKHLFTMVYPEKPTDWSEQAYFQLCGSCREKERQRIWSHQPTPAASSLFSRPPGTKEQA